MKSAFCISLVLASLLTLCAPGTSAAGDAVRGKALYESRCSACHSVDQHRVGPAHQGVFGRKAGSAPGYDYSAAVKMSKLVWSEKTLERWLANPERTIPGQKMGYSVGEANDRQDLIAYLKSLEGRP